MSQLSLLGFRPAPPDVSVTLLLWEAAGRPTNTTGKDGKVDSYRCTDRCWWCGRPSPGWARPQAVLPDTFPYPLEASVPESPHLCLPCGWTLCERIALPASYAAERIQSKAKQGRRQNVSVNGGPIEKWLTLELEDGTVGLWTPGKNAAAEKPWQAAVKALRAKPETVGPCEYRGSVPYSALDVGPVEKFRSFHHFATRDRWWPCTDSDRMEIRAWLLNPPKGPWAGVIGDGKKHHAINAQMLDAVATDDLPCMYIQGSAVYYDPATLARQVEAAEELVRAGAHDEEIASGEYRGRSNFDWLRALRVHEPVLKEIRGGPTLDLVRYIRRNKKELENG